MLRDVFPPGIKRRVRIRSWECIILQENERGDLPGVVADEFIEEFAGIFLGIGLQQLALPSKLAGVRLLGRLSFRRREKLFAEQARFVIRTGAEDACQVLDAFLSRVRGVGGGDAVWNVADKRDVLAAAVGGDSEVCIAAEGGWRFDEVDATLG